MKKGLASILACLSCFGSGALAKDVNNVKLGDRWGKISVNNKRTSKSPNSFNCFNKRRNEIKSEFKNASTINSVTGFRSLSQSVPSKGLAKEANTNQKGIPLKLALGVGIPSIVIPPILVNYFRKRKLEDAQKEISLLRIDLQRIFGISEGDNKVGDPIEKYLAICQAARASSWEFVNGNGLLDDIKSKSGHTVTLKSNAADLLLKNTSIKFFVSDDCVLSDGGYDSKIFISGLKSEDDRLLDIVCGALSHNIAKQVLYNFSSEVKFDPDDEHAAEAFLANIIKCRLLKAWYEDEEE